jgi:hypothetical protein
MVDPRQDVCGLRKRGKVFRVSLALVRRLLLAKCTNFGAHVFVDFVQFLDITRRPNGTYRLSNKGVVSVTAVASPRRSLWACRNAPKFSSRSNLLTSSPYWFQHHHSSTRRTVNEFSNCRKGMVTKEEW